MDITLLDRDIFNRLRNWKKQEKKKALCIIGARQIGKTTAIRAFARENYDYFLEINFILDQGAERIFDGRYDADTIIENLTAYKMQPLRPGRTLIFLDEIQECPNVRTAIKFLVEDGRFDYIESGSLLGVKYRQVSSYAVGFEEVVYMYPMRFSEFAAANGVRQQTFDLLENCLEEKKAIPEPVHEAMLKLFSAYTVVGGMPAVVQEYVHSHDIGRVVQAQNDILELYRLDIAKYAAGTERIKIQAVFDSIPAQLNEKNRRFFLNRVNKDARMNRYENIFLWLSDAGVALPVYNVTEPSSPLKLNEKRNLFKLFLCDTGLLCAACMDQIQFELLKGNMTVNMGSILENVMAQSLKSNGFTLHYFDSKKYGEVDFVIENGISIELKEIKSGTDYRKHPSLDKISGVSNWQFRRKTVYCCGNIEMDGETEYLPWYLVMFDRPQCIGEGAIYMPDLSVL